jgi:3-hydroxybutyryl-CoA dehydrogenase
MSKEAVQKIAVIGSGTMGAGIAQVCLQAGFAVALQDINAEQVAAAKEQIAKFIRRAAEKGQFSTEFAEAAVSRLSVTTDLAEAADNAAWVIEAIFESMDAKRELYTKLNELCPPDTIFASNTSGLSISEIGAAGGRPERTVGLHFFNPVPLMKLVEVVRGSETESEVVAAAVALGEKLGKTVVQCSDSPNFIVNRVNRPVYIEAQLLLQEGVPTRAIDRAMELAAGFRMGPLQTSDLSGINIGLAVTENIFKETGDPRFRPVPLVRKLVRAGHTGKRAGKGFYFYPANSEMPVPRTPDIELPQAEVPANVSVPGESYDARRWRGKIEQAKFKVVESGSELTLLAEPFGEDYRAFARETMANATPDAVFAVMHSLVPLEEIARYAPTPENVVGLYCPLDFYNDKFFEIALGLETKPEAAAKIGALLAKMNYQYVVAPATPAGIARRITAALVNEAAFALQENLASAENIDMAMRLGMNYSLGPFQYADGLGVETILDTLDYLLAETGDARYRACILLRRMVRAHQNFY